MVSDRAAIRSVLLVGDAAGTEVALFEPRFPDVAFRAPTAHDGVATVLERVQPDAVYSINGAPLGTSRS